MSMCPKCYAVAALQRAEEMCDESKDQGDNRYAAACGYLQGVLDTIRDATLALCPEHLGADAIEEAIQTLNNTQALDAFVGNTPVLLYAVRSLSSRLRLTERKLKEAPNVVLLERCSRLEAENEQLRRPLCDCVTCAADRRAREAESENSGG